MASNSFGEIFKITTFGESHGKAIGVVIDGCPAGLEISEEEINAELELRAPGRNPYTSPREEKDLCQILSGTFEGKTTGAPVAIAIFNKDADSSKYAPIKDLLRPGHANFTYLEKYGIFDWRGGGRSSARETAARVAAGAVAKKFLKQSKINIAAYIKQIGTIAADIDPSTIPNRYDSPVFCPSESGSKKMMELIEQAKNEGDSLGGVVEFIATDVPAGLGDPVYQKIEARLAFAMMSLPASKGFEIGSGFEAAAMKGSEHNDAFVVENGRPSTLTNYAGGSLGGISTGLPIVGRVAFKPTSSIKKLQKTVSIDGKASDFQLPEGSRHDPCVAIRAVPIVEAMSALVIADLILLNRCSKL